MEANDTLAYIGSTWGEATPLARAIIWALLREDRPLQRSEIRNCLLQEARHLGRDLPTDTKFEQAFDAEMAWLTGVADMLGETEDRFFFFSIPMVERWLRGVPLQDDDIERIFSRLGEQS